MKTPGQHETSDRPTAGFGWSGEALTWAMRAVGHLVGTLVVAILVAYPMVSTRTVNLYLDAVSSGLLAPAWADLALHLGLAACLWALLVIGWRLFELRRRERHDEDRILRAERGSVMVETLIVLTPFLLLTSGLAQLAMRNVAGLMADLAIYQGARTAWVWEAERQADREFGGANIDQNFVTSRARLASAAALAPSAPADYEMSVQNVQDNGLDQLRAVMYSTFDGNMVPAQLNGAFNNVGPARTAAGSSVRSAKGENLAYASALDSSAFNVRAARKLTFAYLALRNYNVNFNSDTVSVSFDYQMNVVFPWFAYIFSDGGQRSVGGRLGWYVTIERPRDERAAAGNNYRLPNQYEPAF